LQGVIIINIFYNEKDKAFKLRANNTDYMMKVCEEGYLAHVYYGNKVPDEDLTYLLRLDESPFTPATNDRDRASFMDTLPFEYPCFGLGDYRESAFKIMDANGMSTCDLRYVSHKMYEGKPKLEGLPATFATEESGCSTLEITMYDKYADIEVVLIYTAFDKLDVITRSAVITNKSEKPFKITRALSACVDFDTDKMDMITLNGSWARERAVERCRLHHGKQLVDSCKGESSHQNNPFVALCDNNADEDKGEVFGFNFVYSGNFYAQAEVTQHKKTRFLMGINPLDFEWLLEKGESFTCPEVVMVHSDEGIGKMSRTFHDLYRNNLIRGEYKDKRRPILINNWEATYFDFNTDKLLDIAREAKSCGIEMLVMDDGWFGVRNSDNCSLGDWKVNTDKITGGLKHLVDEVNKIGLEFGIWFEPEMISPNSDLYRAHPEWAIQIPGREATQSRQQYVLDLSRSEVLDYVYESVASILRSANIAYVKWDMNRQLSDLGSTYLGAEEQQELFHRYVLGVYALQERLVTEFPDLLLENCSGGGARFDPGMLYYSPQIWCSDDTDAIERLMIQEGTSLIYPLSTMGAHVSDCPNHTVGRVTPFETRGHVALAGTFGYELDVTKIPKEDRKMIPEQTKMYHKYHELVREGDYYRIASYRENHLYDCWAVAAKDKREVLVTYVHVLSTPNAHSRRIFLQGFDPEAVYALEGTEEKYTGEMLMKCGFLVKGFWGDFRSKLYHFMKVNE